MRPQLFIYGSCVARDIVRMAPGRYGLVYYAARQSWISAATKSLPRPQNLERLGPFGTRSVRGDFASNLPYLLRTKGPQADVILIDLASDRHGVFPVGEGYVSNTPELRRSRALESMEHGPRIKFGSRQHQRLFQLAANKIKRVLSAAGLFDRALVLNAPFADRSDNGDKVPLARGLTAQQINAEYAYYYDVLADLGFAITPTPPDELVVASSDHEWGLQQDHYVDDLYFWWADRIDDFVALKI